MKDGRSRGETYGRRERREGTERGTELKSRRVFICGVDRIESQTESAGGQESLEYQQERERRGRT